MTIFEKDNPAKILIADELSIVRKGLTSLIAEKPEWQVVAEASEKDELLNCCGNYCPNLVIIDYAFHGMNTIETNYKINEACRDTKLLMMTINENYDFIIKLMESGVEGIISKISSLKEFENAITQILAGKTYYSSRIVSFLKYNENKSNHKEEIDGAITKQEKKILALLCDGLTSKEISDKLFISQRTVETHRYNLMKKLDLKNTSQLVKFALTNSKFLDS